MSSISQNSGGPYLRQGSARSIVEESSESSGKIGEDTTDAMSGSHHSIPANLASSSATTASSLLYSSGNPSASISASKANGSATGYSSSHAEPKLKSSSLSGRYNAPIGVTLAPTSTTVTSSTTASTVTNGTSVTGNGVAGTATGGSYLSSTGSSSYRLASLDRLAQRQKLYENQNGGVHSQAGGDNSAISSASTSKREQFFKNESSPAPALVTTINSASIPGHNLSSITKSEMLPMTSKLDGQRISHLHGMTNGNMDLKEREMKEKLRDLQLHSSRLNANDAINKDKRTKELDGYVGFANLPNQVYRKAVKKGFDFTLMVVGQSGLGKSTLINSLFSADIYGREHPGPTKRIKKTTQVETCKVLLKEKGVNLMLTIVDTPGFGDAIDNTNCWQPVLDFIESRYEDYMNAESRVNRKKTMDDRVHCCLYFIAPSGHGLRSMDVELMKKLHDKVNIIPVIAKADTMTPEECSHFKKQILSEIESNKIKIYRFPDCDDEEENKANAQMRERVPFAVVGSNTIVEHEGKKYHGRKYPWGTVIVENLEHCDFLALRNMMVRMHMQDLKDITNNVHYENFRCRKLMGIGPDGKAVKGQYDKNPLAQMEEEKKNHESKMKKMEGEMEQVFEMKVKERNQRIVDSELDLRKREDAMRHALEKLQQEVSEKKKQLEAEISHFEVANGMTYDELKRKYLEAQNKEASKGKGIRYATVNFHKTMSGHKKSLDYVEAPDGGSHAEDAASTSSLTLKRSKSVPKRRPSFRGQECAPT